MNESGWGLHSEKVSQLEANVKRVTAGGRPLVRGRKAEEVSHITHGDVPGEKSVSFRSLDKIVEVRGEDGYVWVEPGVTMEKLVTVCLERGCIPTVVPECKGITVGGAIMGAGLESASFLHGQFNDICLEYELLLATGKPMRASPTQASDLFYGLAGSYGTLASLTCVKIAVVPAKGLVRVDYHVLDDVAAFNDLIKSVCASQTPPDYFDGMGLADGRIVAMLGNRVKTSEMPKDATRTKLQGWWTPWFAQRVIDKASTKLPASDYFSVYDYLFRYDRGAFWMGQFVTSPSALFRVMSEYKLSQANLAQELHEVYRKSPPKLNPGAIWRTLLGWKLSTRQLYKIFHKLPQTTRAHLYLVQDFYIPTQQLSRFLDHLQNKVGIYPLWLCPIKGATTGQFLCPHHLTDSTQFPQPDFVNVGVYGIPKSGVPIPNIVRELEQLANDLGGRKVLYSFNFYSPEDFWKVYDRERYNALRTHYGAEGVLANFYEKLNTHHLIEDELRRSGV
ncbi:MAG: FAD-binding protein [Chlamydiales bacterium]|nr:FAD-binding protein [Chlamydiales bacterium]